MKFLHPRHWLSWILVAVASLFCLVPTALRNPVAGFFGGLQANRNTRHRHVAEKNLQECYPELSVQQREDMRHRYFKNMFRILCQSPIMWWWPQTLVYKRIEVQGRDAVDELIAQGRSVAFLVSHSIALDFGLVGLAQFYPLHGIYKPYEDPVIDWVVKRGRNRFGGVTISRGDGLRDIIRNQQAGQCLIYLGDEDLGTRGAVFAPFFKGHKSTLSILPRIARKCDAVVVPMYTHYDFKKQKFVVTLLAPLDNYPVAASVENSEIINATRLNEALEQAVAVAPTQYFWKLKFFKTTEDGSANIYNRSS